MQLETRKFFKKKAKEKIDKNKKEIDLKKILKFLFKIRKVKGINPAIK